MHPFTHRNTLPRAIVPRTGVSLTGVILAGVILTGVILSVLPGSAWAETPPDPCQSCRGDEICVGAECIEPARICETSATCPAGMVCDVEPWAPATPGVCRVPEPACAADLDCPSPRLCTASRVGSIYCAEDDAICAAAVTPTCHWPRLCADGCLDDETCVGDRCAALVYADLVEAVERDPGRVADARRAVAERADGSGGAGCVARPGDGGAVWGLLALLGLARRRRRGSVISSIR